MKYIFPFLLILLSGCGSIPEADPKAVSNFKPHKLNDGDDIGVYLVRPNQFAGGGRDYWVAVDDQVIGDLENSSYVFLSLNSENNSSLNTVVSMAGQNYIGLPESTGKDEYYFYSVDFTTWIPKKLTADVGKTLVSDVAEKKLDQKVRVNDAFDNLAMNPSMVANYMEEGNNELIPNNEYGVVYFFRPSSVDKAMALPTSVWGEDKHLGSLENKQYFAVKLPIGNHNIFRKDGNFHALKLNVKPNKYHYITLNQSFSFTGYNHNLKLIGTEESIEDKKIKSWLKSLTGYSPIPESEWSDRQKSHVERGQEYIKTNKIQFIGIIEQ